MPSKSIFSLPVLDKGAVHLIDYMGSDQRICDSARISTQSFSDLNKRTEAEDKRLIDYLMRNDHTSPFEQVLFVFHIKAPIFVARQWLRHRTARVNEISGRYVAFDPEFYVPDELRVQAKSNHQGSELTDEGISNPDSVFRALVAQQSTAKSSYELYLENGVARELARINLPLSTYTEWYWNIDLHNLLHFLRLRLHHHAQYEIRKYAEAVLELIEPVVPWAVEAWKEHKLHGVALSSTEARFIRELLQKANVELSPADDYALSRLGKRGVRILSEKLGH